MVDPINLIGALLNPDNPDT